MAIAAPKAVELLRYLTAGGWPQTFLYSTATISETSCSYFDFTNADNYSFAVDIAVIENTSKTPVNIDHFLGRSFGGNQLRQAGRSPIGGEQGALQSEPARLSPAERLIVPLGLILVAQSSNHPQYDKQLSAKAFQKIKNSKPETIFQIEVISKLRGESIRKVRESFKPPSYPTISDYAFGPEWALTGLNLNGEKIVFDAVKPDFLEMTVSTENGSCPVLYVWSESEATWLRRGKIIHEAQTLANRQSETIIFDGFVSRFRIAEEELERATISDATLTIELEDGAATRGSRSFQGKCHRTLRE